VHERREAKVPGTSKQHEMDKLEGLLGGLSAFPMGLFAEIKQNVEKM